MPDNNTARIEAKVTHLFAAPPEAVYDALVEPATVRRWQEAWANTGASGTITGFDFNPEVGGAYRILGTRNGEPSDNWGTFLALDRPTRVSYTFIVDPSEEQDPSVVTIIIEPEPEGSGSVVTLYNEMDARWSDYLPQTERAWMRMLEAVDTTLRHGA
ncbi:Uncharacterized conserved protein YndB, AHSA1/START domain [Devosia lucknowensis]|uniref:Uncharacterized conserved protein YndB, AHSA1/START domain n=1 Tax=Devosia lucknowensis TaxID=1096929 RepID=A0A1Y6GDD5_9HYPH|nr:SRPBCC domain-containing protein [Devosia lucknowensis]SMQ86089.1 Uncharacterized conserved protein YndB, AHSA1/START domain [Devosia lucknowensis]